MNKTKSDIFLIIQYKFSHYALLVIVINNSSDTLSQLVLHFSFSLIRNLIPSTLHRNCTPPSLSPSQPGSEVLVEASIEHRAGADRAHAHQVTQPKYGHKLRLGLGYKGVTVGIGTPPYLQ